MDLEQQEMLIDFVSESLDMLDTVEPLIIGLNQPIDPEEKTESVNKMFRLFHTLKGGAGFLNLDTIKEVTHTAENLLQHYRKDLSTIDAESVEILTNTADLIRKILKQVEEQFVDAGFEQEASEIVHILKEELENIAKNLEFFQEASPVLPEETQPNEESTMAETPQEEPILNPNVSESDPLASLLTSDTMQSFIQEAEEQLESTEESLLVVNQLKGDEDSIEFIQTAFRRIHTLKGNAGFLSLTQFEQLSHKTESILEKMKEGTLAFQEEVISLLLKVVDTLRCGVKALGEKQQPILPDYQQILDQLDVIIENKHSSQPASTIVPQEPNPTESRAPQIAMPPAPPQPNPPPPKEATPSSQPPPPPQPKPAPAAAKEANGSEPQKKKNFSLQQPNIRVSIDKIDQLINLVGELVISGAMVTHKPDVDVESESFVEAARQLDKNVRDLQEVAISMRMLPISGVFRKMIRVVHDVSKKVAKNVELKLQGEETEVDRTLGEQIADPLLHLVRNAVDHGIDTPEERQRLGKPKMGKLLLEARQAGNEVWITLSDDGRGLNREKILNCAKKNNLVPPDAEPSDSEVWKMLFLPGFSTKEEVTDLSGRGVGLDVVKRNIDKLRGRIEVASTFGKGSTFILRIPLTLSIIEGMLIRVGKAIYVIPIEGIRESLQPVETSITETTDGMEIVQIRDEMLRVVRLHRMYQLTPDNNQISKGIVIVIENEEHRVCLFVDEVVGKRQVVVKGLPTYFGEIPHLAGCTILGDGDISLILDLNSIINT